MQLLDELDCIRIGSNATSTTQSTATMRKHVRMYTTIFPQIKKSRLRERFS